MFSDATANIDIFSRISLFYYVIIFVDTGSAFSLTGTSGTPANAVGSTNCATDWVTIPCSQTSTTSSTDCQDRLCGNVFSASSASPAATVSAPVYCKLIF